MISDQRIASIKFLVVVLVCVFVSGDDACIEREREALLSFKDGLIDYFDILSSWKQSDECCKWYGVLCSNTTRHVTTLLLNRDDHNGGLRGKVGSSLLELHHLNYLDLSWIDFGRNPIPVFIGSMIQLQHLYLKGSNFSGIIPPQMGNLTNLHSLDLSRNDFGGNSIPEFVGSMKQLQHLYLKGSNFSGIIPPQIGNLTNLRSLRLSYNSLTTKNLDWLSSLSLLSILGLSQIDLSHTNWLQQILSLQFLRELKLASCNINVVKPSVNSSSSSLSIFGSGLESLQILSLGDNQLNGSMPDFSAFPALTELYLSRNNFTGSIPLSIGQLSELQYLDLSYNSLEGSVSESHFIKLDKLKILDLSFNSLILHFAPDWSPPFQLDYIFLAGCNVGPSFPKWIQTQRNLTYLDLSSAGIKDEAPRWLWSTSPLLEYLLLSDNQISGTIPNLSSIPIMDLSYNKFSGPIPLFHANAWAIELNGNMFSGSISSICKIPHHQLEMLDLSNNQLAGEVPNCWENMPNLFSLNLAKNSFSGEIPRSLGDLHSLITLQMHGNNLSGELPYNLRLCQNLNMLDIGGNKLTGELPAWIGEMYPMQFLNLRANKLHGSIPTGICNLTNIQVLDLSINNLSWKIPDCFNNFTVLASKNTTEVGLSLAGTGSIYPFKQIWDLVYSSFQWKGQESVYRKNLELLKLIDFSSNRLTGSIPKSFSSMRGLNSLNLSRNNLTGYIIPDIGKMEVLDSLDLSHNQLSGKIPASLAEIYTLGVLDLSNNNLSGKVPTSTQLQSFNASAYAGNDGLCGPPLALCPEDSLKPSTTNPEENKNEKDGSSLSFMQEVGISMAFGFIFGFWGFVGSLILKKSWRIAFFSFWDGVGDWLYVRTAIFVSKFRRS